jgi:hypothetical protein
MMCIDNVLYAVYDDGSVNDIHYTAIPPGWYMSTDGRNCVFQLISGCTIGY